MRFRCFTSCEIMIYYNFNYNGRHINTSSLLRMDPGYHHIYRGDFNTCITVKNMNLENRSVISIRALLFHPTKQTPQSFTARIQPHSVIFFLLFQWPFISPPFITLAFRFACENALFDSGIQSRRMVATLGFYK